jgi:ABC-type glutathione transport system ATPase component
MSDEKTQPSLTVAPEEVTQAEINEWYTLTEELAVKKEREMTLRKKIFAFFFQAPKEGVNDVPMTDGWVLKGTYKIERKVKEELLAAHAEELKNAKLPLKDLVVLKPNLSVSAYKKLNDDQRTVFDKVLEIKPGAPSLEIVKPKRT